jgi:hypothetical protein
MGKAATSRAAGDFVLFFSASYDFSIFSIISPFSKPICTLSGQPVSK